MCGLALKRPARQISVYTEGTVYHTADIGNDGLFNDPFDANNYSLVTWAGSMVETNPWWMVDLGIELKVTEAILTNRKHWGERQLSFGDFPNFIVPLCSHFSFDSLQLRSNEINRLFTTDKRKRSVINLSLIHI